MGDTAKPGADKEGKVVVRNNQQSDYIFTSFPYHSVTSEFPAQKAQ